MNSGTAKMLNGLCMVKTKYGVVKDKKKARAIKKWWRDLNWKEKTEQRKKLKNKGV